MYQNTISVLVLEFVHLTLTKIQDVTKEPFSLRDFPPAVTEKLMKKIMVRDHEVVVFEIFKAGAFTCLVLKGINS